MDAWPSSPPCQTPAPVGSGSPQVSSVPPREPGGAWTLRASRLLNSGNFPCAQCVGPGPALALPRFLGSQGGAWLQLGFSQRREPTAGGSTSLGCSVLQSPGTGHTTQPAAAPGDCISPTGHPSSGTGGSPAGSPEVSL